MSEKPKDKSLPLIGKVENDGALAVMLACALFLGIALWLGLLAGLVLLFR